MKKLIVGGSLLIVVIIGIIWVFGKRQNTNLISSGASFLTERPTPTTFLTPTPTPIIFDQNSNLWQETEKLTPEDFSDDFNLLKQEASLF